MTASLGAGWAWVNGVFTPGSTAAVSPYDAGFLVGLGVFETVGDFGGRLPLWSRHLARLERGAASLEIPYQPPRELLAAATGLLTRNAGDDVVRVTLTAGVDGCPCWSLTTRARLTRARLTRARPTPTDTGLVLRPTPTGRGAGGAVDPLAALKCTSYAFHALHLRAARAAGADDALLLALDGRVLETTTGNLFLWLGDELHTPAITGGLLLPGVARAALIDELTNASVAVVERDIWLAELEPGAAVFVTNAVHGPRPAVVGTAAAPPARLDARVADAWQRVVG